MNIFVFPAGMPEALDFAVAARLEGHRIVGGSSLYHDPASAEYDRWIRLPLLGHEDFDRKFMHCIREESISRVCVSHHVAWTRIKELLARHEPGVAVVNPSPSALMRARHGLARRQTGRLGAGLEIPAPDGNDALSRLELLSLVTHAQRIFGHSDDQKIAALATVAARLPKGDIVEIGSKAGRSAFVLGWLARRYDIGTLLCIDPWSRDAASRQVESSAIVRQHAGDNDYDLIFECYISNMLAYLYGTVNYIRKTSDEAVSIYRADRCIETVELGRVEYTGRIACLHVDGNHDYEYARRDIRQWSEWLLPGGWLIVDDYHWAFGDGPQRAADEWLSEHERQCDCAFVVGGALFVRKRVEQAHEVNR